MTSHDDVGNLPRAARRLAATPPLWAVPCVWRDQPAIIALIDTGRIALISDGARDRREYLAPGSLDPTRDGPSLRLTPTEQVVDFAAEADAEAVLDRILAAQQAARDAQPGAVGARAPAPDWAWAPESPWTGYITFGLALVLVGAAIGGVAFSHHNDIGQSDPSGAGLMIAIMVGAVGQVLLLIGVVAFAVHIGVARIEAALQRVVERIDPRG